MQISNKLQIAISNSAKFARSLGSSKIELQHLFFALLLATNEKSVLALNKLGVTSDSYKKVLIDKQLSKPRAIPNTISYSDELNLFLSKSAYICDKNNQPFLTIDIAIYLILQNLNCVPTKIIQDIFKLNLKILLKNIEVIIGFSILVETNNSNNIESLTENKEDFPDSLQNLGFDLTKKIALENFGDIIGRDAETEKVIEILCRKTKNNPVLIGEPGVGKSSVVEGLAKRINEGNIPDILKGKIIFSFDIASLVSGTKFRGSMEQKLKDAILAIKENKNIILFIDEIHTLVQAGAKEGEISPADILKPYLARGELHCIGATTFKEYKEYIEKDSALERRFQPVKVEEPSEQDAIKILRGIKASFESFHNVKILDEAIVSAVTLSSRYITNRFLPDKAIDLIDEACSKIKVNASAIPDEVKVLNGKIQELEKLKEQCWKN